MNNLGLNAFSALAWAKSLKVLASPCLFCAAHFGGSVLSNTNMQKAKAAIQAPEMNQDLPCLPKIPATLDLALRLILSL